MASPRLSQGLAKGRRVRKRREYQATQKSGKRVSGGRLVVYASLRKNGDESRLGVTVSKKVGGAVVRNRVRRWIKETFRTWEDVGRPSSDYIVIAKAGAIFKGFHQVQSELLQLLSRVSR